MLNRGVVITREISGTPLSLNLPIAVVGVAESGSLTVDTPTVIATESEVETKIGTHADGDTLPRAIETLQSYGCGNLVVVRVTKGVDDDATATNIKAGLDTLTTAFSKLGVRPELILTPEFSFVDKALEVAKKIEAIYLANFNAATSVADAITARGTSTGMGTKDYRFIPCFPYLERQADPTILDPLATHVAGVLAQLNATNYGLSPGNRVLKGVTNPDVAMEFSLGDEASDNEKLNDRGVMTILRTTDELRSWGSRNGIYPDTTDISSFINAIRVAGIIEEKLRDRARKFLDEPSEESTGRLINESFSRLLAEEKAKNAIADYTVEFLVDKSNFDAGQLYFKVAIAPFTPVELVSIQSQLTLEIVAFTGG